MKSMCMIVLLLIVSTVVVECEILLAGLGLLALKGALLLSAESRRNSRPSYQKQHYYYYPKKTYYDYTYNKGHHYYPKRRYGRSVVEDENEIQNNFDIKIDENILIAKADFQDLDDCAKIFVCEVNAIQDESVLDDVETMIKSAFGGPLETEIDVTKVTARFDLSAKVGRVAGSEHCKIFYGRCNASYDELKSIMENF